MRLFMVVGQPDFGLALVGRQLPRHAAEKITLHRGRKAGLLQHIGPQRGNCNVRGASEAEHVRKIVGTGPSLLLF